MRGHTFAELDDWLEYFIEVDDALLSGAGPKRPAYNPDTKKGRATNWRDMKALCRSIANKATK